MTWFSCKHQAMLTISGKPHVEVSVWSTQVESQCLHAVPSVRVRQEHTSRRWASAECVERVMLRRRNSHRSSRYWVVVVVREFDAWRLVAVQWKLDGPIDCMASRPIPTAPDCHHLLRTWSSGTWRGRPWSCRSPAGSRASRQHGNTCILSEKLQLNAGPSITIAWVRSIFFLTETSGWEHL